ncbi:MAG: hypothetical protein RLZZ584_3915, partial [Pseudomonadota bacterium]
MPELSTLLPTSVPGAASAADGAPVAAPPHPRVAAAPARTPGPAAAPASPAGRSDAGGSAAARTGRGAPQPVQRRQLRSRARAAYAWPTPPLAHYPLPRPLGEAEPCEVEGLGGNLLAGVLNGFDAVEGLIQLTLPNDAAAMPVRLSQLRRVTLKTPLLPLDDGESAASDGGASALGSLTGALNTTPGHLMGDRELGGALLAQAERLPYEIKLAGGAVLQGQTLGCVETDLGLFVFTPLDEAGALQRSFYPRTAWESYELGVRIGTLLVEHQAVSEAVVEDVAREQQQLRAQRLGDVLLARQIVTPEQLLAALDKQARMPMVRLGEALVAMGALTEAELQDALRAQQADRNLSLGELLLRRQLVSANDLQGALARKMGYPLVDLARFTPDEGALRLLHPEAALRLRALPLMKRGGRLVVALQDPGRRAQIDELQALTHCPIAPALASEAELLPAIASAYRRLDPANNEVVTATLRQLRQAEPDLLSAPMPLATAPAPLDRTGDLPGGAGGDRAAATVAAP